MQKLFNRILIPVDFSFSSRQLVEKAAEIAYDFDCAIHLLHVLPMRTGSQLVVNSNGIMRQRVDGADKEKLVEKMHKLCAGLPLLNWRPDDTGCTFIKGSWNEAIIEIVSQQQFDLVLLSQFNNYFGKRNLPINADKLAMKTNVAVMTLPVNRRLSKLYSIVIPVTDFLPLRKLIYGIYLATKHNTTLKLLGIKNVHTATKVKYYLEKAYCLVKEHCSIPVELEMISNNNVAEAVNEFARSNAADLIIVNPVTQTRMPGFFATVLGQVLHRQCDPPILTINQVSY